MERVVHHYNPFIKRRDRYWFEKLSRQKPDREIEDFFVANFASCDDPDQMWIGEIIKNGDDNYVAWKKRIQSLTYTFKEETESIFSVKDFDKMFMIKNGRHPQIFKEYLQSNISFESFMILNSILSFSREYDKILDDPVWVLVSRRMKKYKPFLNIDVQRYTDILKNFVMGAK